MRLDSPFSANLKSNKSNNQKSPMVWVLAVALCQGISGFLLAAPQPIPGVDIIAKRCGSCIPRSSGKPLTMFVGGTNGLPITNDFFFPGFVASNRFPVAEELLGAGGLAGGMVMNLTRYTAPNFGSLPADNIDAKITSFTLTNEAPLVIDGTHVYNWSVVIQSTGMGQMTLTDERPDGGRITGSSFNISYQVTFYPGGTSAPLSITGTDVLQFVNNPPWSSQFPDGSLPPTGNNFVLGYDSTNKPGAMLVSQSGIWHLLVQTLPNPRTELANAVVPAFAALLLGSNYQLQVSADTSTWTNYGPPFVATNHVMYYPNAFLTDDASKLFFRLKP